LLKKKWSSNKEDIDEIEIEAAQEKYQKILDEEVIKSNLSQEEAENICATYEELLSYDQVFESKSN